jgi:hypothetical protein
VQSALAAVSPRTRVASARNSRRRAPPEAVPTGTGCAISPSYAIAASYHDPNGNGTYQSRIALLLTTLVPAPGRRIPAPRPEPPPSRGGGRPLSSVPELLRCPWGFTLRDELPNIYVLPAANSPKANRFRDV